MSGDDLTSPGGGARWRTILLVVMALAGGASVVALVLTLADANRQRDRALEAQRHSYDVMILARTLSGTIAQAEASLGRYVISGDRRLGQLFSDNWEAAGSELDRLDHITSDGQQPRIDALRRAYLQRGQDLNVIALSTRYRQNAQAIALYYRARRAPALAAIDTSLDALGREERRLLDQRAAAATRSVGRSSEIAAVLAAFGALLVLGAAALGLITVRSLAEAAVAQAEAGAARDRAEELAAAVAQATDDLRLQEARLRQVQKMEAVGQLTGGLAHDFNNLLAGISGALELMNTRINQGRFTDVEKYMVAAQGASRRAAALTHRLLAFSRRQTLDPKPTNVNTLVRGLQDLLQRTVGPSIAVRTADAPDLWPTLVDPSQLENAVLNLCINARDAMPDGGKITIETSNRRIDDSSSLRKDMPEGEYLSLCVSDTGVGMTPDVLEKAFDPFYTTKPIGQGTGLGLSMIYGFAKQSGGQVRIHSSVNQGTTVCIYLPRHMGEAENEEAKAERLDVPAAQYGETILVVDDEPTVRLLVTDVLEELGYTVIEATDSSGGLRVLQSDVRIDLLISDVGLPGGLNGRQMADAARESRPDLKVLFITGYAENALLNSGQLEPGMSVLTKPFAVDALATKIHELIAR